MGMKDRWIEEYFNTVVNGRLAVEGDKELQKQGTHRMVDTASSEIPNSVGSVSGLVENQIERPPLVGIITFKTVEETGEQKLRRRRSNKPGPMRTFPHHQHP